MQPGAPAHATGDPQLAAANRQLARALQLMQEERTRLLRQRRVHLVLLGLAVSLPVHILIIIWLASITVDRPATGESAPIVVALADLPEEVPQVSDDVPLADVATLALESEATFRDTSPAPLDPAIAVAELRPGASGSLSIAGGGTEGSGETGLAGGMAGTTFFGVGSHGTRFAYIVDVSGSMASNQKFWLAMQELQRSVENLPDFAYFHVVLFSSDVKFPEWQRGWNRARRLESARLKRWIADMSPTGDTKPVPAFHEVFSLDVLPDVIYFMTDGRIPDETPDEVYRRNTRGEKVVIHTIAFGDESGREALKRIADDSGGTYRFVNPGQF